MKWLPGTVLLCLVVPMMASAQANPLSAHTRLLHNGMRMILLQSAERMPEESYGFKPTEAVRTYGQILGHVADMQYLYCSAVLDETNPAPKVELTKTAKPDLIVALKASLAYCDRAFAAMTDSSGARMVGFDGGQTPRLSLLGVSHMHSALHYGNLVTYMRLKHIVPPTSDPAFMPRPKQ